MNYFNENGMYGMLGKYAKVIAPLTFAKNSKLDKIITADENYTNENADVSYSYIANKPNKSDKTVSGIRHMKQIRQGIFDEEYFAMRGKKFLHLRRYCRLFDGNIKILTNYDSDKVISMIKKWENERGNAKYRMQMHSSYDKRFFNQTLIEFPDRFKVFYFVKDFELIGYSVFDDFRLNEDNVFEGDCLLRKYIPSVANDICYYIDFASYRKLYNIINKPFVVNMGCSSGGAFKYKTTKFPVYKLDTMWFYTRKQNGNI